MTFMNDTESGRLVEAVRNLTETVKSLDARIEKLETTMHTGRGILIALAATIGLFLSDFVGWIKSVIGGAM